jgi:hypothetical protein
MILKRCTAVTIKINYSVSTTDVGFTWSLNSTASTGKEFTVKNSIFYFPPKPNRKMDRMKCPNLSTLLPHVKILLKKLEEYKK